MSKIYTGKEVKEMIAGAVKEHQTALMSFMDLVPDAIRPGVKKIHDDLNEFLGTLPPMEQSEAAPQAAWAVQALMCSLSRFGEMISGLMGQSKKMVDERNAVATELNGIKDKITKGELIAKDLVQSSLSQARQEGMESLLPAIIAGRKNAVTLLGLPEPAEATLKLAEADFNTAVDAAKKTLGVLTARGFKLGGKGDAWVRKCAWQTVEEFNGSVKLIEELHPAGVSPEADPLLGNRGADGTSTEADPYKKAMRY